MTSRPDPKPRRRLTASARRQEILEAATREIAARGYYGTTVERVADACGLTVPGLLHHFPSKDALLVAVLAHRDEADLASAGVSSRDRDLDRDEARAVLDELMRRNLEQRGILHLYAVLNAESLVPSHPAHEYFQARLARARDSIASMVSGWHPSPDSFALQVLAFAEGMQSHWLRDPTIDFAAEWRVFADRLFDTRQPTGEPVSPRRGRSAVRQRKDMP